MNNGILFVGANDMREIQNYVNKYNYGYFIEPIPETFEILKKNLEDCNKKYNTKYVALNYLITNENDKEYDFNIYGQLKKKKGTQYGNNGASSSIYKKNDKYFWQDCDCKKKIKLKSIRMNELYNLYPDLININNLIIDVQGAELEVLKSLDNKLNNFEYIKTEVSIKPHYHNGVLFPELNKFLNANNFYTNIIPSTHMDIEYRKKL